MYTGVSLCHDENYIEHFCMCLLPIYTSFCVCYDYVFTNFWGGRVFCLFVIDFLENFMWHCEYFLPSIF